MARKRSYGSGSVWKRKGGWAIRWRAWEIAPDGTTRRVQRYAQLGACSRREALDALAQRIASTVGRGKTPTRSRVLFKILVSEWETTVLPMYKASTQKHRRFMLKKHLLPRFGEQPVSEITRQNIQTFIAELMAAGYAPKSIDHIHDVLSAVLRTAVKWGHLQDNPARGVDLPKLRCVRPKWALTGPQAAALLDGLKPMPRTMVGLAILCGLRRGELFALRWRDLDERTRTLAVREAVYDGTFDTPKTAAGVRQVPLGHAALQLVVAWRARAATTAPDALVFATRGGTPLAPNNVLRRAIFPACEALGLPRATWLTFRRTFSSWSHAMGVPGKVVAQLMGHANVDTTLNVYTQVLDGSVRAAVEQVAGELSTIEHQPGER